MPAFVSAILDGLTINEHTWVAPGAIVVDRALLDLAGIAPFERVTLLNYRTGGAWDGYAFPSPDRGHCSVPGGIRPPGTLGDRCGLLAFRDEPIFTGARVVGLDARNREHERRFLPADPQAERLDPALAAGRRSGFEVRV